MTVSEREVSVLYDKLSLSDSAQQVSINIPCIIMTHTDHIRQSIRSTRNAQRCIPSLYQLAVLFAIGRMNNYRQIYNISAPNPKT